MSLNSVATPIWNEIAETQELRTEWGKMAFRLDHEKQVDLVEQEYEALLKRGVSEEAAKAVMDMKPLLLENLAISRHIQRTESLHLRNALPEVTTISEAVMLATAEDSLTASQQQELSRLLKKEMTSAKR